MNKKEIINILEKMALLMDLKGENSFKVRAHQNAARTLSRLSEEDFNELMQEGKLSTLKGIGKSLASKIHCLWEEGLLYEYEDLKKSLPPGLVRMLKIPGLGSRKIKTIYQNLGIDSLSELEKACRDGKLQTLSGFGKKTEKLILDGIDLLKEHEGNFSIARAFNASQEIKNYIKSSEYCLTASIAGKIRRFDETVECLNFVAASSEKGKLLRHFLEFPDAEVQKVLDDSSGEIILDDGLPVKLVTCSKENFGITLLVETGSKSHLEQLRKLAQSKGLNMPEKGYIQTSNSGAIYGKEESDLYSHLDLSFIEPELREGMGEIEAAKKGMLPKLVTMDDIKGVIHTHSTYSDGANSLEAMALSCIEAGYSYLVISDHSKSAFYAGGLKEDDIEKQHEEIDFLNEKLAPFRILKGIESDILKDGSLDYPEQILRKFDIVIASVHSSFKMNKKEMTMRLKRAIENPYVDILGHPSGRLVLGRHGYEIDMDYIMEDAVRTGTALELNANPHRLDITWKQCLKARQLGIKVSINPDAHSTDGIRDIFFGVMIARKGWLSSENILNSMDTEQLVEWRKRRLSN